MIFSVLGCLQITLVFLSVLTLLWRVVLVGVCASAYRIFCFVFREMFNKLAKKTCLDPNLA